MKKAQTTLEYVLCLAMFALICVLVSLFWNRSAIIQGATHGVEGDKGTVLVRPMTE